MESKLARHDIVLLGAGHTNAHVLRMWRMKPVADARLTCISNFPMATYSGMLPGVLAGQYAAEKMEIDLVRFCAAAHVRLIVGNVTGLDSESNALHFDDRPPLPFDVLSVGIGSVTTSRGVTFECRDGVLPIKPMQTFLSRLESRLQSFRQKRGRFPLRVAIVGGGVGGVEIAFCLPRRLRALLESPLELMVIHAGDQLANGVLPKTAALVQRELESRNVVVTLNRRVVRVTSQRIELDDGSWREVDLVLWAAGAVAPPVLEQFGLPTDDRGFLLTDATLQSTGNPAVFAVGDSGTIAGTDLPKAGVYAVRQGPVLWDNLRRQLEQQKLQSYRPQRGFLKLLNTGDGQAIGEYKNLTLKAGSCWRMKNTIDTQFMEKYQDYQPMEMTGSASSDDVPAMRCGGCGGKVSGSVLSRVLQRLDIPPSEHVLLGLDAPDDAAIVQPPQGRPLSVTTDFFAAPLDDPYLVGRIAALNALSDVYALGGQPLVALAMASIPVGRPRKQEQLLFELLAGGLCEFRQSGATLVGGHTIEGPQLTIGYTILADQGERPPRTKGRLRAGDQLVLTKPLGTGVLLAAQMQAKLEARWWQPLLTSMLQSNREAALVADRYDVVALTDVTGFGLAGHLLEMLRASDLAAELQLESIPLLPGTESLSARDIESTLAPANRAAAEADMQIRESLRGDARYAVVFDPQTSGGLLIAVAPSDLKRLLAELRDVNVVEPATIGQIVPRRDASAPRLQLK